MTVKFHELRRVKAHVKWAWHDMQPYQRTTPRPVIQPVSFGRATRPPRRRQRIDWTRLLTWVVCALFVFGVWLLVALWLAERLEGTW